MNTSENITTLVKISWPFTLTGLAEKIEMS
jgi:hypothetical protein